jgi:nucleotide-binding universal stress UspA family protein
MPAKSSKRSRSRTAGATRVYPLARRIVTASDGTPESMGALRIAAALQRETGGRVYAITVVEPAPVASIPSLDLQPPPGLEETRRRAALQQLRKQGLAVRASRPWTVSSVIGWPTEAVLEAADSRDADLIVVGIGRHRPIDRLLAHETAIAIVRRSKVPVLAVAPHARKLPRIAVAAVDFTTSSLEAARLAAAMVQPAGKLTLVHVSPFQPGARRDGLAWTEIYDTGAQELLDALQRELAATGLRVDTVVLRGSPPEELLPFSRRRHADLIAVGGHKQGFVDRMVIGSSTTRILRGASSSVLVVPQRERRQSR